MDNNNLGVDNKCSATNSQTANSIKVYLMGKQCLDTSLVPNGIDPEVGCAASINTLFKRALGKEIGGGASTNLLYQCLTKNIGNYRFTRVDVPLAGDIVISPTSYGTNRNMPHGHVGMVALYGILSNNSNDGFFEEHYSLDTWKQRYVDVGGYPMEFFRVQ